MIDLNILEPLVRIAWLARRRGVRPRPDPDELAGHGPQRQPALGRRHGGRDRGDGAVPAAPTERLDRHNLLVGWVIIIVGIALGGGLGPVHRADREDDRDAAAGVAVQRGRRRRGGPHRDRRLPADQLARRALRLSRSTSRPSSTSSSARSPSPARSSRPASCMGRIPGKPIMIPGGQLVTGRARPRSSRSARSTCGPATYSLPVMFLILAAVADLRRDHDPADRRRRHAGRHLPAELVHRHGRGDGRLRARATPS